jgi:Tol biopolymer transport system component
LAFTDALLYAVSPSGEMAVGLNPSDRTSAGFTGEATLAQTPILGGAPRQILDHVTFADWSPTGSGLAVVHVVGSRQRLEFPPGHVLFETEGEIGWPRVSPAGDRIAFLDWPIKDDDRGTVAVVDLSGSRRTISRVWEAMRGLAWAPSGGSVWYTAAASGTNYALWGSTLDGHEHRIFSAPSGLILFDVARDGKALLAQYDRTSVVNAWLAGEPGERNVSWGTHSFARDLSPDGRRLLLTDAGEGSNPNYDIYVRESGSAGATRLGEGQAQQFSPDGKSVLAVVHGPPAALHILSIGIGAPKIVMTGQVTVTDARWLSDGKRLLIIGTEQGKRLRAYVTGVAESTPRPISPEGITYASNQLAPSPDGSRVPLRSPEGPVMLYPTGAGEPVAVDGLAPDELPSGWTVDGRALIVLEGVPPRRIVRLDLSTGRREILKDIRASDPALVGPFSVIVTPDGHSYVANYGRFQISLFLAEGLKD